MKTVILDTAKINRILKRIAYQVVEACYEEKALLIAGILPRGVWVAEQLKSNLDQLTGIPSRVMTIDPDIPHSVQEIKGELEQQCVILVDDIINSGETMMSAASMLMECNVKRLITACLVDRKHRNFPIQSDFTGLSLATTMQEHLSLVISDDPVIVLE